MRLREMTILFSTGRSRAIVGYLSGCGSNEEQFSAPGTSQLDLRHSVDTSFIGIRQY